MAVQSPEQGFARGQTGLGRLYEHGTGVPLDYVQAYKWYSLAAAQKDEQGARSLRSLVQIMTTSQIRAAQLNISDWRSEHDGF